MKLMLKIIGYSVAMVIFLTGCALIFKQHPEVQFAFIMPGLFMVGYSIIRDDIFSKDIRLERRASQS